MLAIVICGADTSNQFVGYIIRHCNSDQTCGKHNSIKRRAPLLTPLELVEAYASFGYNGKISPNWGFTRYSRTLAMLPVGIPSMSGTNL